MWQGLVRVSLPKRTHQPVIFTLLHDYSGKARTTIARPLLHTAAQRHTRPLVLKKIARAR
jgi:hypothetical protein